jgi:glycosyltransferase involved in cell wall biosynthesis
LNVALAAPAALAEPAAPPNRFAAEAPLRIVHVLRAPVGGLFRHVVDLSRAQIARGHRVGLIVDSLTGGAGAEAVLADLAPSLALGVVRLPMQRKPHISDARVLARVVASIRASRPDVVHGHGSKGGVYARADAFLPGHGGAIRAYTPHGGSFHRYGSVGDRMFMAIERALARRTDVLLFESAFIAGRFDAAIGPARGLTRVVPNGIAPPEFQPVRPNADAAEFVYVGELRLLKGIDTLLSALGRVSAANGAKPALVLVGAGPDAEELRQQVRTLGLESRVSFAGPMPARAAFALGRVLVVPSRAESLPYIVLEAAGARIPLVATGVGGIPEVFGPYRDRLIPSGNPDALAAAMGAALDRSPAEAAAEAEALAAYVAGRFSVANMVDGVLEGYRAAIERRDRKRVNSTVTVSR